MKRKAFLVSVFAIGALAVGLAIVSQLPAMRPSGVPEPESGTDRVIDRVQELFPQTEHWFDIVATAEFTTSPNGRIVPEYPSLTHERVRWEDAAGHTIAAQFARRFRDATRVGSGEDEDAWIDLVPDGGRDVVAQIQDGLVVYPDAYRDTDVLYKSTPTHTDEYLLLRTADAPTSWRYRVRLGPKIARLRQAGAAVEGVDAQGVPWMRANPPFAVDQNGDRADGEILVDGDEIVVSIDVSELELPILVDPDWRSTGDMSYGRFYNGGNLLPDGRVLVTGGCSASVCSGDLTLPACRSVVSAAEALDLDTDLWSRVADGTARVFFHVSESLPDGSVLVAGGCANSDCSAVSNIAEIFDVAMGAFRTVSNLPEASGGSAAARLPDGRILVAGGCTQASCTPSAYAFNPVTDGWETLSPMNDARGRPTTSVLADGRVLVAGGCTNILCSSVLSAAEIYDPTDDSWTRVDPMSTPRAGHYAATLFDGRVLVGGGCSTQTCGTVLRSSEVFDPSDGSFTASGNGQRPRLGAVAARLPDGTIMVNQGCSSPTECDLTNELWEPASGEFSRIEDAVTGRGFHALVEHGPRVLLVSIGGCQPRTCSWWNETYDMSAIMPPLDGGVPRDTGPRVDTGPPPDGGTADARSDTAPPGDDAGMRPRDDGGCGCTVPGRSASAGASVLGFLGFVGLLGLLGLLSRRRRRRSIAP